MALQIRRGPTTDRTAVVFLAGEIIYDTTLNEVFIGDGTTLGGRPVTSYTDENAKDAAGALLTTSTGNVAFTYNPTGNALTANVTLDGIGITSVSEDTTPELGGDLSLNGNDITGTGNINITGTVTATSYSGVTATMVGLGNVTNESKATMFSSPTFTGTVSGVTATHVGLGNVTNESKATMFTSPSFTGTTTLDVVNINGLTTVTSLPNAPTEFIVDDNATTTSQSPALKLKVIAGAVDNSGPTVEFFVDTNSTAEEKLSRIMSTNTADGPSLSLSLYNGTSFVKYVEALNNAVIFNDTLVIKDNGLFNHTTALPTITPGTDITIYSEGNIVTYGNILPGIEGTPVSGDYSLGSETQQFKEAHIKDKIVIKGGVSVVPATSIGASGDVQGTITVDGTYLYYCVADYDGTTNIWRRTAWDAGTW